MQLEAEIGGGEGEGDIGGGEGDIDGRCDASSSGILLQKLVKMTM